MLKADYSSYVPHSQTISASDTVSIPDAHLLFNAQFSRTAHDLILTDADGSRLVVSGYFDRPELPALASPDGAMLLPDVVRALAGPLAPGQYAQAAASDGGTGIGKVTALTGSVTAQHADGTVIELHVGDTVFQGDVLQSGPGSSVGIVFADDTVFSLSANARMVLNELVYHQGGADNSMVFSLVEGTFSLIAGKVAPTGEMKINTPVASMGIRGTCVSAGTSSGGKTQFALCMNPDGKTWGHYEIRSFDGSLLATVDTLQFAFVLTSATGEIVTIPRSEADQIGEDTVKDVHDLFDKAVQLGVIHGALEGGEGKSKDASNGDGGHPADPTQPVGATPIDAAIKSLDAPAGDPPSTPAGAPLGGVESSVATTATTPTSVADTLVNDTSGTGGTISQPVHTPDTGTGTGTPPPDNSIQVVEGDTPNMVNAAPIGQTVTSVPVDLPAGVSYAAEVFTFDPNDPAYDHLRVGQQTTVTVDYQLTNGPASVTWTVTGTNDSPHLTVDGSGGVVEDASTPNLTDSGTLSFTDPDTNDSHTVTKSYNGDDVWSNGTLSAGQITAITSGFSADSNSWDYTVANSALQFLGAGETITLSFNVTVKDNSGAANNSDTQTVTLTLTGTNDAPVITNLGPAATNTSPNPSIVDSNVTISDAELDAANGGVGNYSGATLTVVRGGGANADDAFSFITTGALFSVNAGTLRDNSDNIIANFSTSGNSLLISFTSFATAALVDNVAQHIAYANTSDTPPASIDLDYTMSDGADSTTDSITVNITNGDLAPVAAPDNVITNVSLGSPIVIPEAALLANDTDADGGGPPDVNGVGGQAGGTVSHTSGSGASGTVTFTDLSPAGGSFTYTATDGISTGPAAAVTVSSVVGGTLNGTAGADILIAANGGPNTLNGHAGNDQLVGGNGLDTFIWANNDGYDTIYSTGSGADIIHIQGTFYDYNWTIQGNDLIVGVAADDNYDFADVGGSIRLKDFLLPGNDSIAYLEADLGPNNIFYSPGGGDARIYFSTGTGTDQGNYFELIVGTSGDDVMTDSAGTGQNRLWGGNGNDQLTVIGVAGVLIGGNGNDTLTGGAFDDQLRGAAGDDTLIGGGGTDVARYDRPAGSAAITSGAFVNLSDHDASYDFNGSQTTIAGGTAIDNYGDTDTLSGIENVEGSNFADVLIGTTEGNTLRGNGGNDIIVAGGNNGVDGVGADYLYGGGGADSFVFGTETGDTHIEDFELGTDRIRLQGDVAIASMEVQNWDPPWGPTTVVTLTTGATIALVSVTGISDASQILAPPITGTNGPDTVSGTVFNDTFIGGAGVDTYVWSPGDGNDTIVATGAGNTDEDIIQINGSFYDYNWDVQGNDLLVGVTVDDNYQFAGGYLRIQDFFAGGDSVAYLTADLGANNEFYSPGGGDARIYLSAVNGTDQGNYLEVIFGTSGPDTMDGGGGAIDLLRGRGGSDTMSVSDGTRGLFRGGNGGDFMTGADQSDQFIGGAGDDTMNGGPGDEVDDVRYDRRADSAPFSHGAFVNLSGTSQTMTFDGTPTTVLPGQAFDNWGNTDTLINIENVYGSNLDDIVYGSDGSNFIVAGAGVDYVYAGNGNDEILGGAGNDQLYGEGGNDILQGYAGNDYLDGGSGTGDGADYYDDPLGVTVDLAAGTADDGYGGHDTLVGIEEIYGSFHDDHLYGDDQDNYIEPRDGTDVVDGRGGSDTISYSGELGTGVTVNLAMQTATDGNGNTDEVYNIENVIGSAGNDSLTGDGGDNILQGLAGNDTLNGGTGGFDLVDYYSAPSGVTVNLAAGTAAVDGYGGSDTLINIDGILGSFHNDTLTGTAGTSYIEARDGDDTIYMPDLNGAHIDAGPGQDTLVINGSGATIDTSLDGLNISGVETVDLGTGGNSLSLSGDDVVNIGESNDSFTSTYADNLVVEGDSTDSLTLRGAWVLDQSQVTLDGTSPGTYDVYNYSESGVTASLAVDHDVAVNVAA